MIEIKCYKTKETRKRTQMKNKVTCDNDSQNSYFGVRIILLFYCSRKDV